MCLLQRDGKADRLMTIGLVFLMLANLSRLVFNHTPSLGEATIDGITGLLFGVAIGSLLGGIWRKGRGGAMPKSSS